jgi:hypothetical protein
VYPAQQTAADREEPNKRLIQLLLTKHAERVAPQPQLLQTKQNTHTMRILGPFSSCRSVSVRLFNAATQVRRPAGRVWVRHPGVAHDARGRVAMEVCCMVCAIAMQRKKQLRASFAACGLEVDQRNYLNSGDRR